MVCEDPEEFFKYTRLYVDEFVTLTNMVKDRLVKRSCLTTITVEEQLAITLSYLSQGSQMCEVSRSYLRGRATVCRIIRRTCNALWEVLYEKYLQPPERWAHIKSEFNNSYLHNIVDNENQSGEVTPGLWRTEIDGFENIQCQGSRNYSHEVTRIRDELCICFNSSAGSVPWQDGMI
ncbi:hypothetical protein RN001_005576 [Aquatica leii]|uniref:Nuclease HARBI1 n=1 Tax=Aquatica leii TaxID=1421715 RepID=A0AAN7SHX1_9COLE|nr:hypothetical protein RN001_005576 [Aquatica leii]